MKNQTAIFVGRFQPLHKGHVFAIKNILKRYEKVVIAVGSVNKKDGKNPFSYRERKSMLDAALAPCKKRYRIAGIADFGDDKKWHREITKKIRFDVLVTANPWTARCFSDRKTEKPKMLDPKKYNATRIRKLISEKKNWQSIVPKEIIPIIRKHFSER